MKDTCAIMEFVEFLYEILNRENGGSNVFYCLSFDLLCFVKFTEESTISAKLNENINLCTILLLLFK